MKVYDLPHIVEARVGTHSAGTGVENPEFVGDNWQKEAGDTEEYKKLHRAAWDLAEKGMYTVRIVFYGF